MKIAFLLSRIEQSGVTTHTLDLAEGLIKEGHQVYLITGGRVEREGSRINDFYNNFIDSGVVIMEFKVPKGNLPSKIYRTLTSVYRIVKSLRDIDPDVIHCQSPYMTFVPWLMGKKFTATIHNTKLERNIKFKKPTHLIAISNESMEMSKNVFGIEEKDTTIVHHGVSDRYSNPLSMEEQAAYLAKYNIAEHKTIVGFVGRTTWEKGCDVLVKALADLDEVTKDKMHCIFLGGIRDSDDFNWLQTLINDSGIGPYCTMVPFQDPKPFYDIFDIFVLPSRMESFPLVTIEAMMAECCPVRSNTEGCYEQIEHRTNGMLFENEDAGQLTQILLELINNQELRTRLGRNAKTKALKEFTIPIMTKNTLAVYDKIRIH